MKHLTVLVFLVLAFSVAPAMGENQDLHNLLVYGKDFAFSVKEPRGWFGDIEAAKQFEANIVFYPSLQSVAKANAVIRVSVFDKSDEDTQADLAADMKNYSTEYPGIAFKDFAASHPRYKVFPKLFNLPGSFYEYVSYINPGPGSKLMFSVSMNTGKTEAQSSELQAYRYIIASLGMP